MMEKKEKKIISLVEIVLMISMSFAIAYFINEADKNTILVEQERKNIFSSFMFLYKNFVKYGIGDKGIVSAETLQVFTCLQTKNNSICQEFTSQNSCKDICASDCIPTSRKEIAQCRLGTCYDSIEGTCQPMSPKAACESGNGLWLNDENGNIAQCQKGCCIVGEQTFFSTSQECNRKSQVLGITKDFRTEVRTELSCLILSNSQEEGACVFESEFENSCKFTTKSNCLELTGKLDSFYSGLLCSNPSLDTNCEKQQTAKCVDGKDDVYWFDSCGNKENIYDSNKLKSWNEGKVLSESESCALGSSSNPFANQGSCGNCNYILGSICGDKTAKEKLNDAGKDFVCRDLSCKDSEGNVRQSGESWCVYNSAIGVDKGSGKSTDLKTDLLRGIDTPGSRHFRQVCVDGEVRTEPCADYRNEICIESKNPLPNDKTFSSAACRVNRWQQCLDYNTGVDSKDKNEREKQEEERNDLCNKNPDCFVKEVNIDSGFKFNMCAPKYPAGFDLSKNAEGGEGICSLATQKCTVVYVKGFSGWKCKQNCGCREAKFTEQLNDLCMSLGDCGASVNYQGSYTENIKFKNAQPLSPTYLSIVKKYYDLKNGPNKYVESGNASEFFGELGIPEGLGEVNKDGSKGGGMSSGMLIGAAGVAIAYGLSSAAGTTGAATIGQLAGANINAMLGTSGSALGPSLAAFGGALAGAAIGYAVVSLLINYLVPGLDKSIAMALTVAGAVAGAVIGANIVAGGATFGSIGAGGLAAAAAFAWIGIIVIIVIIIIFSVMGIGKTKKVVVEFSCNPWQAPTGGAKCNQCGKDSGNAFLGTQLPCSKYECQSLGQTCEFINEGTGQEACVDISPNDVNAPIIKPNKNVLQPGFSYDEITENGFRVKSEGNDGCVKASSSVSFGITLNEPAQCRMDVQHTNKFEDMEFDFGGRSLFLYNHSMFFSIPSIESLGLPGYDPNRRADYSLYVRCQDKNGNKNINEYTINFCVKPGDDLTAPIVTGRDPIEEYVKYNATEVNADIFVNEPSECKWDVSDRDYDLMSNSFSCNLDIEDQELYGWKCSSVFPLTGGNTTEKKFYVRCKDQPWLIENADTGQSAIIVNEGTDENGNPINRTVSASANKKRNKNMQSYELNFKKSNSQLKIDSLSPENRTLVYGVEPASVTFEVKTSGGAENGKAECLYLIGEQYIPFFNTFSNVHNQVFESFTSGNKEMNIRCKDVAGNIVERTSKFRIELDKNAPKITRVYDSGNLVVITDEPAECYVSTSKCNFDIQNSTIMSGEDLIHSIDFERGIVSYIKCKDRFGNTPGSCSLMVRGGKI